MWDARYVRGEKAFTVFCSRVFFFFFLFFSCDVHTFSAALKGLMHA